MAAEGRVWIGGDSAGIEGWNLTIRADPKVVDVIPSIRKAFEAGGWAELKDGKHVGGDFLVGYAGRLFLIASDFQVGEAANGFEAVGCGMAEARGAMWVSTGKPRKRLMSALEAAAALNAGVRGPFTIIEGRAA